LVTPAYYNGYVFPKEALYEDGLDTDEEIEDEDPEEDIEEFGDED